MDKGSKTFDEAPVTTPIEGTGASAQDDDAYQDLALGFASSAQLDAPPASIASGSPEGPVTVSARTKEYLRRRAIEQIAAAERRRLENEHARDRLKYATISILTLLFLLVGGVRYQQARTWEKVVWPMGMELVVRESGQPYGVLRRYEERHIFRPGEREPAYQVRLYEDGKKHWFPKRDIFELCRPSNRFVTPPSD